MMVVLPFLFSNSPAREDMAATLGCPWPLTFDAPVSDAESSSADNDCEAVGPEEARRCRCRHWLSNKVLLGAPTPEAILTHFVSAAVGMDNVVDSCPITGPLLVNGRNTMLNRPCLLWEGDSGENDFAFLDKVVHHYKGYLEQGDIERRTHWN